jgi:hypothetical protein
VEVADRLKRGVGVLGLSNAIILGDGIVSRIFNTMGFESIITSGTEDPENHKRSSEHKKGDALDYRTRHVSMTKHQALATQIRNALGKDFDVILESNHIHVEYDPK